MVRIAWVAVVVSMGMSGADTAAADASGAPSVAPGSPAAVLELLAGSALREEDAVATGVDVETRPFISHFVSLRIGASYVSPTRFRGQNPTQLGARVQVAAGWSRFELGIGLIALQHADSYNSGRMNADLSLDIALTSHWRLRAEHWSNSDSSIPNIGRDIALICYRF